MKKCDGCVHAKMYDCSQGREFYPNGNADICSPTKKKRGFELPVVKAEELWFEFINGGLCGLCGNSGYVDTTLSAISHTGERIGIRQPCICPNGRKIKRHM